MDVDDVFIGFGMLFMTWVLGWGNSCWFPFLLSAKWYIRIPNRILRSVLLFGRSNWDRTVKVAPEDRDKMSLTGAVTYLVLGADSLGVLILGIVLTACQLSPLWEARLSGLYMVLGKGYLLLAVGAFLLGCVDYYTGRRDHYIRK